MESKPPVPPLTQITLTGITTIIGKKLVLLKLQSPAKPFQPQKEESCILSEGQKDGAIEVLQIDPKSARVKVRNAGTVMVLTFEKNGPKPAPLSPRIQPRVPWWFTARAGR